ncbi:MAG: thioredoxin domain-containing protein [Bacteriovoracia bacterium]
MKSPRRLVVLIALFALGLGVSFYQTFHFFQLRNGAGGTSTFCDIGQTFSCTAVEGSPYAELLPGFPIAAFAAGWFLSMLVAAAVARNAFWRRECLRILAAMTGFGLVVSSIYLFIMVSKIGHLCLLCLVVDAVNLASFGLVMSLKPEGTAKHPLEWAKWRTLGTSTAVILVLAMMSARAMDVRSIFNNELDPVLDSFMAGPTLSISDSDQYPSIGPKDAPVTIVKFADYQCPSCKVGANIVHPLLKQFPGKIRLVSRNFPLDSACNRLVQSAMHPVACRAAKVALCGSQQGKFDEMYTSIYDQQEKLSDAMLMEIAEKAQLDMAKFKICLDSPEVQAAIARDVDEGEVLKLQGTPTFFVNGKRLNQMLPLDGWVKLVNRLLAAK